MAQKHSEGMVFKATKITGPSHHFLGVKFTNEPLNYEVRDFRTKTLIEDDAMLAAVGIAVNSKSNLIPILGRFYVKTVFVDERDRPAASRYSELFTTILDEAKLNL